MLTYNMGKYEVTEGEEYSTDTSEFSFKFYKSGFEEFSVYQFILHKEYKTELIHFVHPSILIVLEGSGIAEYHYKSSSRVRAINKFDVFYLLPEGEFKLENAIKEKLVVYIATCGNQ